MTVQYRLDPINPPVLTPAQQARLDGLTEAEISVAAEGDADNLPLSAAELARVAAVSMVRRVRAATGLSQAAFAAAYRINLGRLRDLEQGRTAPDSALLAYLTVIAREPEAVRRALAREVA